MKSQQLCTLWLVVALVYFPASLFAQTSTRDWLAVQNLKIGTRISIEAKNGDVLLGELESVSDTSVIVRTNNRQIDVRRDDIRRIFRHGGSRLKSAAIGAAIGAGVGAGGAGALLGATGGSDSTSKIFAIGVATGAGIGAAIGTLLGSKKKKLVYQGT